VHAPAPWSGELQLQHLWTRHDLQDDGHFLNAKAWKNSFDASFGPGQFLKLKAACAFKQIVKNGFSDLTKEKEGPDWCQKWVFQSN